MNDVLLNSPSPMGFIISFMLRKSLLLCDNRLATCVRYVAIVSIQPNNNDLQLQQLEQGQQPPQPQSRHPQAGQPNLKDDEQLRIQQEQERQKRMQQGERIRILREHEQKRVDELHQQAIQRQQQMSKPLVSAEQLQLQLQQQQQQQQQQPPNPEEEKQEAKRKALQRIVESQQQVIGRTKMREEARQRMLEVRANVLRMSLA